MNINDFLALLKQGLIEVNPIAKKGIVEKILQISYNSDFIERLVSDEEKQEFLHAICDELEYYNPFSDEDFVFGDSQCNKYLSAIVNEFEQLV
jgi:hypothetical protein